jgi:hypothetical protein
MTLVSPPLVSTEDAVTLLTRLVLTRLAAPLGAVALFAVAALAPGAARAEDDPALISFGSGQFDTTALTANVPLLHKSSQTAYHPTTDLRLEYRSGISLVPFTEPWFKIKPWGGVETNPNGEFYGVAGFLFDGKIGPVVITESEGVGLWARGGNDNKNLGSVIEFRSQIEVGYEFDNRMRLTAFLSHMSNANITNTNPGANTLGGYLHVPVNSIVGLFD